MAGALVRIPTEDPHDAAALSVISVSYYEGKLVALLKSAYEAHDRYSSQVAPLHDAYIFHPSWGHPKNELLEYHTSLTMTYQALAQSLSDLAARGLDGMQEEERSTLVQAATKLRDAFENPGEKMMRVMFSPYEMAALKLGVDMGLFDNTIQKAAPITVQELAEARNLDPALVGRIMRLLSGLGTFAQKDVDTYVPTSVTGAYSSQSPLTSFITHFSCGAATAGSLPAYFEKNNYQTPNDTFEGGPWQFTHNEGESWFQWALSRPKDHDAFNKCMASQRATFGLETWYDIFPAEEKLQLSSEEADRVLLVDVGGGTGHDIKHFHDAFPHIPGKLVLEDLEPVLVSVDAKNTLPPRIQAIGHDFFTPQSDVVKGAKAFYLRLILHDWADKQARIILSHIRDAMAPDSLLLVNEHVLPEIGAPHSLALADLHMMTLLGAKERVEKEWRKLLESSGFEVRKVWAPLKEGVWRLSLIEAVRKG